MKAFAQREKLTHTVLLRGKALSKRYHARALPAIKAHLEATQKENSDG